jgi:hypothetical protein
MACGDRRLSASRSFGTVAEGESTTERTRTRDIVQKAMAADNIATTRQPNNPTSSI